MVWLFIVSVKDVKFQICKANSRLWYVQVGWFLTEQYAKACRHNKKRSEMSEMKHMPPPTLFKPKCGRDEPTRTDLSAQRYMSSARAPTEFLNLIYGVAANKQWEQPPLQNHYCQLLRCKGLSGREVLRPRHLEKHPKWFPRHSLVLDHTSLESFWLCP